MLFRNLCFIWLVTGSIILTGCIAKKTAPVALTGDFGVGRSSNTTGLAFGFRNNGTEKLTVLTGTLVIEDATGPEDVTIPVEMSTARRFAFSEETGRYEPGPFFMDPGEILYCICISYDDGSAPDEVLVLSETDYRENMSHFALAAVDPGVIEARLEIKEFTAVPSGE